MYKLVVIDDEPLIIAGLKKYLDWGKYNFSIVGEAEDGVKGIEICKRLKPDLIVTDIRMPEVNGIELIAQLKKELKDSKFVILSGYGEFEYAQQAVRVGACDYILKPLKKEQFIRKGTYPRSNQKAAGKNRYTCICRYREPGAQLK